MNHKENLAVGSLSFYEDNSSGSQPRSIVMMFTYIQYAEESQLDLVHSPTFSFTDVRATAMTHRGSRHIAAEFAVGRSPLHHQTHRQPFPPT